MKRSDALTLVVRHLTVTPSEADADNQRFWKVDNPRANELRIAKTRTAALGAIVIEAADKATFERLQASVAVKDASFAVSGLPERQIRDLVHDVPTELSGNELRESVCQQNPADEAVVAAERVDGLKAIIRTGA